MLSQMYVIFFLQMNTNYDFNIWVYIMQVYRKAKVDALKTTQREHDGNWWIMSSEAKQ